MGTASIERPNSRASAATAIQSANVRKSSTGFCPSPAIKKPPFLVGVGSSAPISKAYKSLERISRQVQERELNDTLAFNADLLEYGYNTGAVTENDIAFLSSNAPAIKKLEYLRELLPKVPFSGNNLLSRKLETCKQQLSAQGFNPEFIQRAIDTNDMSFGFTLADDNTPVFCVPDMLTGITYPLDSLNENKQAATILLYQLLEATEGGTPSQILEAMHPVELVAIEDTVALRKLLECHKDTENKAEIYQWFYQFAEFIKKHDAKCELGEHFFFRAEELPLDDFIEDPKGILDKVEWLVETYDTSYSILSETLVYSELVSEDTAIRNAQFAHSLNCDSPHAPFLKALQSASESIESVRRWHCLEVINDFFGIPYAHIPFEYSKERSMFFDFADELYQSSMEAGEVALMYKINDFDAAFKHFDSLILSSLLCSMLRLYSEKAGADPDDSGISPFV